MNNEDDEEICDPGYGKKYNLNRVKFDNNGNY